MAGMTKGRLITIEGADGCGKTTMSRKLAEWLNQRAGIKAVWTGHPGSTPVGKELRKTIDNRELTVDVNTRALMFAADNSAFINQILKPNLEKGVWVVADRSNFISSLAYQIADGCPLDHLEKIHAATYPTEEIPKMDLLLVLRVDYETAVERTGGRENDEKSTTYAKLMEHRQYFDKISNAYNMLMDLHVDRLLNFVHSTKSTVSPDNLPRCLYIDANKDEDVVFTHIEEAIKSILHEQIVEL